MKYNYFFLIITVVLCTLLCGACIPGSGSGSSKDVNFDKDASYSLGYVTASDWLEAGIVPDLNELLKGFKDVYAGVDARFPMEIMYMTIDEAYSAIQMQISEIDRQKEIDFLAQNSRKEGIIITNSGLQYEILSEGRGARPGPNSTVRIHFEVASSDGAVIDSTYERGEPADIPISDIFLDGWAEGLQLMSEGSSYRFFIPSDLGYGSRPMGQMIPAYSTLVMKVDLINIVED